MSFNVYDTIVYLKYLEKKNHNKKSEEIDYKWENYKNIIVCRLINFNTMYNNSKNIGIRTMLVTHEYCIFEVIHNVSKNIQYFFVQKSTDNIALLGSKKKNQKYVPTPSKNIVLR